MAGKITFTMIKPCAFGKGNMVPILSMIHDAGFKFRAMKVTKLSLEQAMAFYSVHKERSFYDELCEFMSSGHILAAILEKENAVEEYRKTIGATNPENAAEGTIRKRFATDIQMNAVHGSDSDENAIIEGDFFFSHLERF